MFDSLIQATRRWQRDEVPLMAAAVSYYLALSLFPVLLILTSALGIFFKWTDSGHDARDYILQVISNQMAPALADSIAQTLVHVEDYSSVSGPVGLVVLFGSALAIFSQFERGFARIWSVPVERQPTLLESARQMMGARLRAFGLLCSMGLMLVAVFIASIVLSAIHDRLPIDEASWVLWCSEWALKVGMNTLAIASLYRFLPTLPVRWRHAWQSAFLVAVIWHLGLFALTRFLIGSHYASAYGVIGCFLAVMLWNYYAVSIVFFGAELVRVIGLKEPQVAASLDTQPSTQVPFEDQRTRKQRLPNIRDGLSISGDSARSRLTPWFTAAFDTALLAAVLYVGVFLAFRHFRADERADSAGAVDEQRVVRFSADPKRNQIARRAFAPLIRWLPGPYSYSDAKPERAADS